MTTPAVAEPPPAAAAPDVGNAAGSPTPVRPPRYHDLDVLRGTLMMMGVAVHTATLGDSPVFDGATLASGLFRMEAFMVVSGFLSLMMLRRYGAAITARRRLVAIGLPFAATLLLVNPLVLWLVYRFHNAPIGFAELFRRIGDWPAAAGPVHWHLQLWFLVPLLAYIPVLPVLGRAVDWAHRLLAPRTPGPGRLADAGLFAACCAAVAAACLASRVAYEVVESALPGWTRFPARETLYYLPFYALGLATFASPRLLATFRAFRPIQLALAAAAAWGAAEVFDDLPKPAAEAALLAAKAWLGVALVGLLLWSFALLFAGGGRVGRYLSDAAYSVYLFHFLAIYLLASALWDVLPAGEPRFVVVALLAFAATLAVHQFVILRVPVLRLLFNGRRAKRRG